MTHHDARKVRAIVVDDSAFMRRAISNMLASDPDIEVIATAANGRIAIEKITAMRPDIVTMDIEMPELDGISALKRLMAECPTNIIIISSLTQAGSKAAMDALAAGAADVLAKDHSTVSDTITDLRDELVAKAKLLARRDPSRRLPRLRRLAEQAGAPPAHTAAPSQGPARPGSSTRPATPQSSPQQHATSDADPEMSIGGTIRLAGKRFKPPACELICIGSSTGGPSVVEEIIRALPADMRVPVVVAQHMPFLFTKSMADRFDSIAAVRVIHAADRMPIEPGRVYIAPGGSHTQLIRRGGQLFASVGPNPDGFIYKPSVDVLLASAAEIPALRTFAAVLTGMGSDGADGAQKLAAAGGTVIAQDQETSVVYGMPRAVAERGIAAAILPPAAIAAAIAHAAAPLKAAG